MIPATVRPPTIVSTTTTAPINDNKEQIVQTKTLEALTSYEKLLANPTFKKQVKLPTFGEAFLEKSLNELLQAIGSFDWMAPIFEDSNYPYYALEALKRNKLSLEQFGTTLIYYSLTDKTSNKNGAEKEEIDRGEVLCIPLFKDQKINLIAKEIIWNSLAKEQEIEKKFDQFIQEMKSKPTSEQMFFLFPDIEGISMIDGQDDNVAQRIRRIGYNIFFHLDYTNALQQNYLMAPSISMLKSITKVSFPYPLDIIPMIGPSTLSNLKDNVLKGCHDMGLPFPGLKLPLLVDGLPAPYAHHFWRHDFYHTQVISYCPPKHRLAFIHIATRILQIQKLYEKGLEHMPENKHNLTHGTSFQVMNTFINNMMRKLYFTIVDLEHGYLYHKKKNMNQNQIFWYAFNSQISIAIDYAIKKLNLTLEGDDFGEDLQGIVLEKLNQLQILNKIFNEIRAEKEYFEEKFSINFKEISNTKDILLEEFEKRVADIKVRLHEEYLRKRLNFLRKNFIVTADELYRLESSIV